MHNISSISPVWMQLMPIFYCYGPFLSILSHSFVEREPLFHDRALPLVQTDYQPHSHPGVDTDGPGTHMDTHLPRRKQGLGYKAQRHLCAAPRTAGRSGW